MQIPTLNPLRFYKPNTTKLKDNLSFADSSDYWNDLPGAYTPKFQDQTENIVYQDIISGAYGFSSIAEFDTPSSVNPIIKDCKLCVDSGRVIYSNLDDAVIGKIVTASFEGTVDIQVRENATVIFSLSNVTSFFSHELTQDYTNLNLTFQTSIDPYCIKGVALCEPELDYKVCDYDAKAELIDLCGLGGVYLLTSNIKWYNLNNDISEKLSVYSLDFYLKHDQSQGIDFYIQINTDILQIPLNAFSDATLLNDFVTRYDWISYNITGLVLTVTIPSIVGGVYLLAYENGALRDTDPFALDSQYVDPLYVYTSQNDNNIDEIGSDIKITVGKIGGLPVALWQYVAYNGILEIGVLTENTDYTTDGNTIDFSDEGDLPRSSYVQISKKGKIYGQCCRFEVGDYYSEYFTIITEAQKQSLKLLNLTYSSEFMDLNVAFSSLWTAALLVNAQLLKGSGSDIEVFVGQQSNTNLENFSKRIRVFKTGAIPDYLSDMLSNIFGFDTIQIEGENYAAEEGPEESQFEERTDLFQLEIILRKQNFDFLI